MKKIKRILVIILFLYFIGINIFIYYSSYKNIKKQTIKYNNNNLITFATEASRNIETYIDLLQISLRILATSKDIINFNENGRIAFNNYFANHTDFISGITRIDERGKIIYTVPFNKKYIGMDVSKQPHNASIIKNHRPALSDILTLVQGYKSVVLAYPVFQGKVYKGSISVLIPFKSISNRFFKKIHVGEKGAIYAFSKKGIGLFCPGGKQSTSFINKIKTLISKTNGGHLGTIKFSYKKHSPIHDASGDYIGGYKKIKLFDTFWTVLVIVSEDEIANPLYQLRNKTIIISVLFLLGIILFFIIIVKSWVIVEEENKRKRVEKQLLQKRSDFLQIVETLPTGILSITHTGEILFINKRLKKLFGFSKHETPNFDSFIKTHVKDQQQQKILLDAFQQITTISTLASMISPVKELKLKTVDNQTMISRVSLKLMTDEIIITFEDITEIKKNLELEHQLQEKEQRSSRMESIGLMAGGVAHDLNNILSGVVTIPELMLLDLDEDSPLRDDVIEIHNAGVRASEVVSDLLTVARGVASTKSVVSVDAPVNKYLTSSNFKTIKSNFPNIKFVFSIDPIPIYIECSLIHIEKSIMNLIINATEAISKEGEISIATRKVEFISDFHGYEIIPSGKYAVISIKDNGSGISPEDQEKIFEPFYSKKVLGRSGTGLGLAIVWNSVRNHEGFINLESSSKGTLFELYFPITDKHPIVSHKSLPGLFNGHGLSVLIVDDEEIQRKISAKLLMKMGFEVLTADSGEKAIEYLSNHEVDLIILDMIMNPGMDGTETFQEIIKHKPDQKCIIVSGYSESTRVREVRGLGAQGFLQKPFGIQEISDFIETLFSTDSNV